MKPSTFAGLATSGRLGLLLALRRLVRPAYRIFWLAGASSSGILRSLARGPVPFARLAAEHAPDPAMQPALDAWLHLGAELGEVAGTERGWSLRGSLARALADPGNDAVAAMIEEIATLHPPLLVETPLRTRRNRPFTLADQNGPLVARASRVVEPFVGEAVDDFVPTRGAPRLLEIGCGSGTYLRRAARRNGALTALGLELQPAVAEQARANLRAWGLAERVSVETGDVRARAPEPRFDVATMHNCIYYFPVDERVSLLRHVRGFLRPEGTFLLTTACRGGGVQGDILDVWGAATAGCGRLPEPGEMTAQLGEAGFGPASARSLVPGARFFAFVARA